MFEVSLNATLDRYRKLLGQVSTGQMDLPKDNVDAGESTGPRKYRLNDETPQGCSTRSRNRPLGVLRRRFGLNSWNSSGIRLLPMRPSESQKCGRKFRSNLSN